jgi:hypothetical protein
MMPAFITRFRHAIIIQVEEEASQMIREKSSTHSPVGGIINHMLFYDRLIAFLHMFYVCI